ncbi:hypothetical protein Scep_023524 [Stephania cephalantha]|uniref:DUF7887 domain-containing protein n=1 Tax=Stephania cephalantha TaxID=152367 RepID=A0AAP0HXH1_9MAGN
MLALKSFFIPYTFSPHFCTSRNYIKLKPIFYAQKQDSTESPKTKQEPIIISLRVPNVLLARSAVAILCLGFIDAGYSGDWSRIGVISRETEELLKITAYVVVPLCFFLIFSISKESEDA